MATISYRVFISTSGWQGWVSDGQIAGIAVDDNQFIDAIQINLVTSSAKESLIYQARLENIGRQGWVSDGMTAGSDTQKLHVEEIKVDLLNNPNGLSVVYRAYSKGIGWEGWVSDGDVAGTFGRGMKALRIQIL